MIAVGGVNIKDESLLCKWTLFSSSLHVRYCVLVVFSVTFYFPILFGELSPACGMDGHGVHCSTL